MTRGDTNITTTATGTQLRLVAESNACGLAEGAPDYDPVIPLTLKWLKARDWLNSPARGADIPESAFEAWEELREQIIATPATSMTGLVLKLRSSLADMMTDRFLTTASYSDLIDQAPTNANWELYTITDPDVRISLSALLDAYRLAGIGHQGALR